MVMTNETTVVETVTGLFTRRNLTLHDPPLISINCTWNCGPEMWIVLRTMEFSVLCYITLQVRYTCSTYVINANYDSCCRGMNL